MRQFRTEIFSLVEATPFPFQHQEFSGNQSIEHFPLLICIQRAQELVFSLQFAHCFTEVPGAYNKLSNCGNLAFTKRRFSAT